MKNKKWSEWLYVVMLNRAPIAVYSSAYLSIAFLRGCVEVARQYGDHGQNLSDYRIWRERHNLEFPLQFEREEMLKRWCKTLLSDLKND